MGEYGSGGRIHPPNHFHPKGGNSGPDGNPIRGGTREFLHNEDAGLRRHESPDGGGFPESGVYDGRQNGPASGLPPEAVVRPPLRHEGRKEGGLPSSSSRISSHLPGAPTANATQSAGEGGRKKKGRKKTKGKTAQPTVAKPLRLKLRERKEREVSPKGRPEMPPPGLGSPVGEGTRRPTLRGRLPETRSPVNTKGLPSLNKNPATRSSQKHLGRHGQRWLGRKGGGKVLRLLPHHLPNPKWP